MSIKRILSIALCIVVLVGIIVGMETSRKERVNNYNNGFCPNCNCAYHTSEHYEKGDGETYITYKCDCGNKGYVEKRFVK